MQSAEEIKSTTKGDRGFSKERNGLQEWLCSEPNSQLQAQRHCRLLGEETAPLGAPLSNYTPHEKKNGYKKKENPATDVPSVNRAVLGDSAYMH